MENLHQEINDLLQKRKRVVETQRDITKRMREANVAVSDWDTDTRAAYDKAEADFTRYDEELRTLQALAEKEQRIALTTWETNTTEEEFRTTEDQKADYNKVFNRYLRSGKGNLSAEERSILRKHYGTDGETRAQTVTTTAGGYVIPEGFAGRVEKVMAYYGPMLEPGVCGSLNTASGNDLPYPTLNDTSNTGRLLAINTAVTTTDLTFGQVVFNAYKYSSDQILVPVELLEDEQVNLEQVIGDALGERLGRIMNQHLTTGTGSSQPNGVVTASSEGKEAASATAITRPELVDLIHSVDRAYRVGNSVGFMFKDSTLAAIKKLALGAGDATPLWQPSIREGEPDRLEGYRYWVNNDMAAIATGAKTILFGDFSKYLVRRAGAMRMRRLDERYADADQVGYFGLMRIDGDLIATGAIKHLVQA